MTFDRSQRITAYNHSSLLTDAYRRLAMSTFGFLPAETEPTVFSQRHYDMRQIGCDSQVELEVELKFRSTVFGRVIVGDDIYFETQKSVFYVKTCALLHIISIRTITSHRLG